MELSVSKLWRSTLVEREPRFIHSKAAAAQSLWQLLGSVRGHERSLMLVGPRPGGGDFSGWAAWRDGQLPEGWSVSPAGHYADPEVPVLRFVRGDGVRVDVRRWHGWVDEAEHTTASEALEAWRLMASALRRQWPEPEGEACVLGSPAATGRHLWQRTIPRETRVEVCSTEVAELLRSTSTQGRAEVFGSLPGGVDGLVVYDARLAYLAGCRGMGWGEPVRHRQTWAPDLFAHGRAEVTFMVPAGWRHPGLLPVLTADGWRWPRSGTHRGWVDMVELHQAHAHGWTFTVHQSMTWPARGWSPLQTWASRIVKAAELVTLWHPSEAVERQAVRSLRAVGLYGIGAFQGRTPDTTHRAAFSDAVVPEHASAVELVGDELTWRAKAEGSKASHAARLAHPEWTSTIWARARVRLASAPTSTSGVRAGFMHVEPEQLLGCRTDSLWLTRPQHHWTDDGQPGRYRIAAPWRAVRPSVARPTTWRKLEALKLPELPAVPA